MPYQMFHELFPELAKQETRSASFLPGEGGDYGFVEMYCNEPGCDCRRVYFSVLSISRARVEAVISWGWESSSFYRNWPRSFTPTAAEVKDMKGPSLAVLSEQSEHAPALLEFVRNVLLKDPAYVERIKRHYQMFRDKIEKPAKTEKAPKAEKAS